MATEEDLEKFRKEGHVAFVVGYTGETGKELVKALSATKPFTRVVLIGRRKSSVTDKLGEGFVSSDSKNVSTRYHKGRRYIPQKFMHNFFLIHQTMSVSRMH